MGFNGKAIKQSTVKMYDANDNEVDIQSKAEYIIIREEYMDGTFREVWGEIEDELTSE